MVPTTVNAVNAMKLEMLRDLDQIINTRPRPPFDFRAWMETRRASYNAWLARLLIATKHKNGSKERFCAFCG